eukprot:CAMPEP_0172527184 /NCGR_PEP_ID=MMETSP1067-20121228/1931_1 /TAXON_ID=265564 ORGANISM="Thalassiosira punctigera, Strain Tpunct2005C2" /NCGR_SAMPLE_ID=MMETSP1067 /ASSEMBLY_ACC=CAM_ASM_000444 /LENGTH=626 /DNA_ID=CAMNT_0013310865 /DNA_START=111 /DNA_END=1991 /DNA_ORIENTATION=+
MSQRLASDPNLAGLRVILTIHCAQDLLAKDRNLFGKKKTSDPYVKVLYNGALAGKTPVKKKTCSPTWECRIKHVVGINDAEQIRHALPTASSAGDVPSLQLVLYDWDKGTADDPLGEAIVPIAHNGFDSQWFPVLPGEVSAKHHAKKAKGKVCVSVAVSTLLLPDIVAGNVIPLRMAKGHSKLTVGLGWHVAHHQNPVDLDVSCVAVGTDGRVLLSETVYFANLKNPNRSIVHSGDEREGLGRASEKDGNDDREVISIDIDQLPQYVAAYVLLVTVATPGTTFSQITSARVRICDGTTGIGFCAFRPAYEGEATAMFCLRMSRKRKGKNKFGKGWDLATIGATDATARDFGSLVPEIKGFCRDLFPELTIDPNERFAVMNKEMTVRVRDYAPERNVMPSVLAMGLAWDVTNGVNIDLDASAVCLDSRLNMIDLVYFKNLRSADGSIHHSGDEREGDEIGDDEKIIVALNAVDPKVEHIVFVINSYSEQELDDVDMASCHLFDPMKRVDLCTYTLTNNSAMDGHTALLLADLYRDEATRDWMMRILSVPSQGKTARRCINHISDYLRAVPPSEAAIPPNPDVIMTQMPVAVPIEEDISFAPMDEEIVVGTTIGSSFASVGSPFGKAK